MAAPTFILLRAVAVTLVGLVAAGALASICAAQTATTPAQRVAAIYSASASLRALISSGSITNVLKADPHVFVLVTADVASDAALANQVCQAIREYYAAQGQPFGNVALYPAAGGAFIRSC